MTVFAERLRSVWGRHPQKTALTLQQAGEADLSIDYDHLLQGAQGYNRMLAAAGIVPGDVVVLILQHGVDLVHSYLGIVLRGAIPSIMPFLTEKLAPQRYREDLASLVAVTRPAAILTYRQFEPEIRAALGEGSSVRAVLFAEAVSSLPIDPSDWEGLRRQPDEVALLQHSSGTTGLQKGVALSHRAIFNQLNAYSQVLGMRADDVIVSWLPLYHDMGLIAGFLLPILGGNQLVLMSPFDWVRAPQRLLQAVSTYQGTLSWMPNFAYNFCAQKVRDRHLEGVDLSSWRAVINCSEPVRRESHVAFLEKFSPYGLSARALQCSYAMAENVFAVTQTALGGLPATESIDRQSYLTERVIREPREEPGLQMMSSGKPLPNAAVRIVDEAGAVLPERVIGEIALRSDCMLSGYFNRPDATALAFREGWFLTGDFGYLSDGEVYVTGRKKDLIIVGGKNIYPQDLEALACEVPGVHAGRAVAFGLFDEEQGTEEVVVVAEVDSQDPVEQDRVAEEIRSHITRNSAITLRHVRVVGPRWILKTSSGKTARSANREKFLRERGAAS